MGDETEAFPSMPRAYTDIENTCRALLWSSEKRIVGHVSGDAKTSAEERARLLIAATDATDRLDSSYDPVESIKALPDLLDAVYGLLHTTLDRDIPYGIKSELQEAIKKAEGKSSSDSESE